VARLPNVSRDARNATASAFRTAQAAIVAGEPSLNGALAIPLMTTMGRVGVFAIELARGGEQLESVRALASIFAAQFAPLVETAYTAPAVSA
jgi:hypothetical protein